MQTRGAPQIDYDSCPNQPTGRRTKLFGSATVTTQADTATASRWRTAAARSPIAAFRSPPAPDHVGSGTGRLWQNHTARSVGAGIKPHRRAGWLAYARSWRARSGNVPG